MAQCDEYELSSTVLLYTPNSFNNLFAYFIFQCFGFDFSELIGPMQYLRSILLLPFEYELPQVVKQKNAIEVKP
jgi:hypothetical protein